MMARNQMTLLCFSVLFAVAVFKGYSQMAHQLVIDAATAKTISCAKPDADDFPASKIPVTTESKWRYNFMYPVEVCFLGLKLENAMFEPKCDHDGCFHHITTEVQIKDVDKVVNINYEFDAVKVRALTQGDKWYFCHFFKVSEITAVLDKEAKDKSVEEAKLGGHSVICSNVKVGETATIQSNFKTPATYYFDKPGSLDTQLKPRSKWHAVVCGFQDCKVEIKGEAEGTPIVERFNVTAGKFPTFVKGATNNVGANQFSVTVYECKKDGKCPTAFMTVRVGATPGLNASFRLTIGSILVALFTLYC